MIYSLIGPKMLSVPRVAVLYSSRLGIKLQEAFGGTSPVYIVNDVDDERNTSSSKAL